MERLNKMVKHLLSNETAQSLIRHFDHSKKGIKKLPAYRRAKKVVDEYKLIFAITSAIIVCFVLTAVSLLLYGLTGTSKVDLSRPGYELARKKIDRSSQSSQCVASQVPNKSNGFVIILLMIA